MAIVVRAEKPDDIFQIHIVNEQAFGQPTEAALVMKLRRACPDAVSLVADDAGELVGHILFTPVEIAGRPTVGMGLAPMAVTPSRQRQGIGSALVRRGLTVLRARGCPFVVVIGHPEYYPRFGFQPASTLGLSSPWPGIPDAAFMALPLDVRAMAGVSGVAQYRREFDDVA